MPLATFLNSSTAASIMTKSDKLVTVTTDTRVLDAFKALIVNNILSVPVQDGTHFIGLVDVIDIMVHVMKVIDESDWTKGEEIGFESMLEANEKFLLTKCKDIVNLSSRNGYLQVFEDADLSTILSVMSEFGNVHRIPIVNSDMKLVGMISQSDMIREIGKIIDNHPAIRDRKLEDIKLGYRRVVSLTPQTTLRDAFQKLKLEEVSGAAVIDGETGKFLGSFSSNDLKSLGYNVNIIGLALQSLQYILDSWKSDATLHDVAVVVRPSHTIGDVFKKFVEKHTHRLWIVDRVTEKPLGVISLIDMIEYIREVASSS